MQYLIYDYGLNGYMGSTYNLDDAIKIAERVAREKGVSMKIISVHAEVSYERVIDHKTKVIRCS